MRRILKLLVLGISIMCFSISASAAIAIQPFADANASTISLSFSGSTAYCSLTINGATGTTKIDNCTVTLRESNGTLINQWTNQSATGTRLSFDKSTTTVTKNKTYTLSFSATIYRNGKTEPISGSITKTYT